MFDNLFSFLVVLIFKLITSKALAEDHVHFAARSPSNSGDISNFIKEYAEIWICNRFSFNKIISQFFFFIFIISIIKILCRRKWISFLFLVIWFILYSVIVVVYFSSFWFYHWILLIKFILLLLLQWCLEKQFY